MSKRSNPFNFDPEFLKEMQEAGEKLAKQMREDSERVRREAYKDTYIPFDNNYDRFSRAGYFNGWDISYMSMDEGEVSEEVYEGDINETFNSENINDDLTTVQKMIAYKFLIALDNVTDVTELK
jgi:hypothetical protein